MRFHCDVCSTTMVKRVRDPPVSGGVEGDVGVFGSLVGVVRTLGVAGADDSLE